MTDLMAKVAPAALTDEELQPLTKEQIAALEACFGTYVDEGDMEPEWLIPGVIHPGITCVTGQPEVGKTTLLISMVKGLLAGEWLETETTLGGRAILFGCEDIGSARKVRQAFSGDRRVRVVQLTNWNPDGMASVIEDLGVGLVVIDSLYAVVEDVNDQGECGSFTRAIQALDVPVLVVHHQPKMGTRRGPAGAQGYQAAYRHTIGVRQHPSQDDELILDLAMTGNDVAPSTRRVRLNRTDYSVESCTEGKTRAGRPSAEDRAAAVAELAWERQIPVAGRTHNEIAGDLVGGRQDSEDPRLALAVADALGLPSVKFRAVSNSIRLSRSAFDAAYASASRIPAAA
jgi:hypothetical protein